LARSVRHEAGAAPPARPSAVSRALGPTAGPQSGNARAILAFSLAVAYVGLLTYLTVMWLQYDMTDAKDLALAGWGALGSAFTLITGLYFGRRTGEGA
jgi:hypothetical protein